MRIGISYGCLVIPATLISEQQAQKAVQYCLERGWFFQGLPFRQFHKLNVHCRYIEDPWPGIKFVDRQWAWSDESQLSDKIVFSSPKLSAKWLSDQKLDGSRKVGHSFESELVEIHKGIGTMEEISEKISSSTELVLDTNHLRSIEGFKMDLIPELVRQTSLVHVQPLRNSPEWDQFFRGNPTELETLLRAIRNQGFDGDFVIETTPFYHNRGMKDFREQISKLPELLDNLRYFAERVAEVLRA